MATEQQEIDEQVLRGDDVDYYQVGGKPSVHRFDIKAHMARLASAPSKREHIVIGVQNLLTTELMRGAFRLADEVPDYMRPRAGQFKQIEGELHAPVRKDKHLMVMSSMPFKAGRDTRKIDFNKELQAFSPLDWPNYYKQPFHSVPGGWLNPLSMTGHRAAIDALYKTAHRRGGAGLREDVAALVPKDAKVIYDFGASTSDQATAMLSRVGADATVHCVEGSPYGHIVGKYYNSDPRIQWHYTMIEDAKFAPNSADVVNIMFVLHECPDFAKADILDAAFKLLKPGGRLILTEPPPTDLEELSRGFFEPYRLQWLKWDPDEQLRKHGFSTIEKHDILPPIYTYHRVAHKPLTGLN